LNTVAEQRINRLIWRTRRGARELDGLLMTYAEERASTWSQKELTNFEELLAQPDPVLMDWFMHRTRPRDTQLKGLVADILASKRRLSSA
tara:strand:+ start:141 stop:410 length:270 start_codon:yes stop_codon:yes gene_type:complete